METRFSLRYEGAAVESGLMPVHEAASTMVAFSQFVVAAVKVTFGDQAQAHADVAGFSRGSFTTDLVFHVAGVAATVLTAAAPKDLLEIIKQSFELWKFLRGEPPREVRRLNDGIQVTNNNGQIIQVRAETFSLVVSEQSGKSVSGFVQDPLRREGVERLVVESNGDPLVHADRSEAGYFGPVVAEVPVSTNVVRMTLLIEGPEFQDQYKWRFSDGQLSFTAAIEDVEFLVSVARGERFGKGDRLDVDMRIDQGRRGDKFHAERFIVKVHQHLPAFEQAVLFSRKPSE